MEILFLGHSAFLLKGTKNVLIDPFLTGNPSAAAGPGDLGDIDMVLVTHGHGDHLGDALDIAKEHDAVFVAMHEIANFASSKGVLRIEPMNIGGSITVDGVVITMTNATHSSDFEGGSARPAGFVVAMDGHRVYHAGDTGVFCGMGLICELYHPEVAILPIGSRYTMDVGEAIKAVELLEPSIVIPMHYGTFPLIDSQDPNDLAKGVGTRADVRILAPGESTSL